MEKINSITGYDYKFVETSSTPELLNTIKAGKTDFGVAGISLTSEREKIFYFSHVFFNSGLQILIQEDNQSTILDILSNIFSPSFLKGIGFFIILILISAHIIW
ncbi:MAG: transporter substrate-binding domain-containing protein [Desulfobacterales bacterium]|nr:transporter substrate-binding domain-containing protein [Desulfobacterales bacterium]MCP4161390.1 transporter substrate-binding domain-containing protein [Deltaproteobacteria bacterium]